MYAYYYYYHYIYSPLYLHLDADIVRSDGRRALRIEIQKGRNRRYKKGLIIHSMKQVVENSKIAKIVGDLRPVSVKSVNARLDCHRKPTRHTKSTIYTHSHKHKCITNVRNKLNKLKSKKNNYKKMK